MTEGTENTTTEGKKLTLRKSAKLRHRTLIRTLFEKGKSVYSGPLRVTYLPMPPDTLTASFRNAVPDRIGPVQIMITVPKKKRRHAVDRVLMRRRIREAFRLQYQPLRRKIEADAETRLLAMAIVYNKTENVASQEISEAMAAILAKIQKKLFTIETPQPLL